MARVLISVPPRAKRGEIVEIKTLIRTRWKAAIGSAPTAA